jgi:dihydropteroate synthase
LPLKEIAPAMRREIYVRPLGLYAASLGEAADAVWGGLRLAGGWLDFTALEILQRNGARLARRIISMSEFMEKDWGRRTLHAADMFEALRAERPRLAGLSMDRPRIMGIVNVTPNSFSDGGRLSTVEAAIDRACELVEQGADILDIGGESTRPGSDPVPLDEELRRVVPVIEGLRGKTDARISIDTRKAEVMRRAAKAGADILNDVSALSHDPGALAAAAETGLPVVLMHAQGDPKTMQDNPRYDNVLLDVFDYLASRIAACRGAGIPTSKLVVDPGIGFGKTLGHCLELMSGLSLFHGLGVPVLLGASRKSFTGALTGTKVAAERVHGSVAAALQGVSQGVQIVRVHDVAATRQALTVWVAGFSGRAEAGS